MGVDKPERSKPKGQEALPPNIAADAWSPTTSASGSLADARVQNFQSDAPPAQATLQAPALSGINSDAPTQQANPSRTSPSSEANATLAPTSTDTGSRQSVTPSRDITQTVNSAGVSGELSPPSSEINSPARLSNSSAPGERSAQSSNVVNDASAVTRGGADSPRIYGTDAAPPAVSRSGDVVPRTPESFQATDGPRTGGSQTETRPSSFTNWNESAVRSTAESVLSVKPSEIRSDIPQGQNANIITNEGSSVVPDSLRSGSRVPSEQPASAIVPNSDLKSPGVKADVPDTPAAVRPGNNSSDLGAAPRVPGEAQTSAARTVLPDATINGVADAASRDNTGLRQSSVPALRTDSSVSAAPSDASRTATVSGSLRTGDSATSPANPRNIDTTSLNPNSLTPKSDLATTRGALGTPEGTTGLKLGDGTNAAGVKPGDSGATGPSIKDTAPGTTGIDPKTSDAVGSRVETSDKMPNPKVDSGRTDGGTVKMSDPKVDSGRTDGGTSGMRDPRGVDGRSIAQTGPSGGSSGTPFGGDDSKSIGTKGIKPDSSQILPPGMLPDSKTGQSSAGPRGDIATKGNKGVVPSNLDTSGKQPAGPTGPHGGSELVLTGDGFGSKGGASQDIKTSIKDGRVPADSKGQGDSNSSPGTRVSTEGKVGNVQGSGSRVDLSGKVVDSSIKPGDATPKGAKAEVPIVGPTAIPVPDITGSIKQIGQRINEQIKGIKETVADVTGAARPGKPIANGSQEASTPFVKGRRDDGSTSKPLEPQVKTNPTDSLVAGNAAVKGQRGEPLGVIIPGSQSDKADGPKTVRTSDGKSIVIGGDATKNDGNTTPVKGLVGGLAIGITGIAGGLKGIADRIFPHDERGQRSDRVESYLPGKPTVFLDNSDKQSPSRSDRLIPIGRVLDEKAPQRAEQFTIVSKPNLSVAEPKSAESVRSDSAAIPSIKSADLKDYPVVPPTQRIDVSAHKTPSDAALNTKAPIHKETGKPQDANLGNAGNRIIHDEHKVVSTEHDHLVSGDDEAERLLADFELVSAPGEEEEGESEFKARRFTEILGRESTEQSTDETVEFDSIDSAAGNDEEQANRYDYMVEPGDTLESISADQLKDVNLAPLLYQINQELVRLEVQGGHIVFVLTPGTIISLPHPREIEAFYGTSNRFLAQ